ncbi:MAG TPA: penicillin acylase family protein [Thermoanaerobaculia bacterium]|nr:penicillin acylase family protein [Thermoanaerobaculia bacterium]
MKLRLRKILKFLALGTAVLLLLLALAGVWLVRRSWPQVAGEIRVAGLHGPVEVLRDRWGVPNLYARDEHDLFFAQGYVHAQDRLWQMEFNRRVSSGTLGEILGPGLLEADKYLRTLGLRRAAQRDWQVLDAETRGLMAAYSDGVNAYVAENRGRLPLEFLLLGVDPAPWTPVDSLGWGKLMSLNLSFNHPYEILRARLAAKLGPQAVAQLLAPYPADGPVTVPSGSGSGDRLTAAPPAATLHPAVSRILARPPFLWASNSWAVRGERTVTGRPLLANDTHLGLGLPSVWYENGLHGGRFDATGFSFPGLPLVVIGHNRRITWGITNLCADVQDLYTEKLDDRRHPSRYQFRGVWRPLAMTVETLQLKGAAPVRLEVRSTHHGPIINDIMPELAKAEPTALRWVSLDGDRLVSGLRRMNLAGGWRDFHAALRDWVAPSVNFTYADVDGNIGYHSSGRVPLRVAGHEGLLPVPGWSGQFEWRGFIPFDAMPRSLNPAQGFVLSANNKVVGDDYPYFLTRDMADPYRARRIRDRLAATPKVSAESVRTLQADVTSLPAAALRPFLLRVTPRDDRERRALEEVRRWDLRLTADSPGAALFEVWLYHLWSDLFADELGDDLMRSYRNFGLAQVPMLADLLAQPASPWFDDVRTAGKRETRDEIVARSFTAAVSWLAKQQGDDPRRWSWGGIHSLTFAHAPLGQSGIGLLDWAFNSETLPMGGDTFTVNEATPDVAKPYASSFGVAQRLIVDLADFDRTQAINSTGQSGLPFHAHRDDQVRPWWQVKYHSQPFSRGAVEKAAQDRLTLRPQR